ncbi:MAG TPA: hypothetical protein VHC49_10465 [Mycobacteriales bacterium]|nr:hypothetical protein [Mycobacteriales bacterium]
MTIDNSTGGPLDHGFLIAPVAQIVPVRRKDRREYPAFVQQAALMRCFAARAAGRPARSSAKIGAILEPLTKIVML